MRPAFSSFPSSFLHSSLHPLHTSSFTTCSSSISHISNFNSNSAPLPFPRSTCNTIPTTIIRAAAVSGQGDPVQPMHSAPINTAYDPYHIFHASATNTPRPSSEQVADPGTNPLESPVHPHEVVDDKDNNDDDDHGAMKGLQNDAIAKDKAEALRADAQWKYAYSAVRTTVSSRPSMPPFTYPKDFVAVAQPSREVLSIPKYFLKSWTLELYRWWSIYNAQYCQNNLLVPRIQFVLEEHDRGGLDPKQWSKKDTWRHTSSIRWDSKLKTFFVSVRFVAERPWEHTLFVLRKQMARQYLDQILFVKQEIIMQGEAPPYDDARRFAQTMLRCAGDTFDADLLLAAQKRNDPIVLADLQEQNALQFMNDVRTILGSLDQDPDAFLSKDKVFDVLLAVHRVFVFYNIDVLSWDKKRHFCFTHLDLPKTRHQPFEAILQRCLLSYFFIEPIWVPTYNPMNNLNASYLRAHGTPPNLEMASFVYEVIIDFLVQHHNHIQTVPAHPYRDSDFNRFATDILGELTEKIQAQRDELFRKFWDERGVHHDDPIPVFTGDMRLRKYVSYLLPSITSLRMDFIPIFSFLSPRKLDTDWIRRGRSRIVLYRNPQNAQAIQHKYQVDSEDDIVPESDERKNFGMSKSASVSKQDDDDDDDSQHDNRANANSDDSDIEFDFGDVDDEDSDNQGDSQDEQDNSDHEDNGAAEWNFDRKENSMDDVFDDDDEDDDDDNDKLDNKDLDNDDIEDAKPKRH